MVLILLIGNEKNTDTDLSWKVIAGSTKAELNLANEYFQRDFKIIVLTHTLTMTSERAKWIRLAKVYGSRCYPERSCRVQWEEGYDTLIYLNDFSRSTITEHLINK
ncbi:hypothetical protein O9G_001255 [Rozella allomycis CSF55]|uniref:Uncharacterized protein n=1 Tax=Rozella allomycis (strain CSF55) TaxID=988480 RepID=A0A075AY63_ROZAC|nr:hypothetical protein O9G_001255 [Rozella allomycis CSF55]|eukprot:EPZ33504.1 hypothetical protein O9G_001255 [Rozella allomycis CSF55]